MMDLPPPTPNIPTFPGLTIVLSLVTINIFQYSKLYQVYRFLLKSSNLLGQQAESNFC